MTTIYTKHGSSYCATTLMEEYSEVRLMKSGHHGNFDLTVFNPDTMEEESFENGSIDQLFERAARARLESRGEECS